MKTKATLFLISILLLGLGSTALAQKIEDYYKFDDNGYLCEFQLTLQDSVVVKYKHLHDGRSKIQEDDYALILYPDGTTVDFSASYFNMEYYPDKYPAVKCRKGFAGLNEYYKYIKQVTAPKGSDMIKNMLELKEYTIVFPDNSQLSVTCNEDIKYTVIDQYLDYNEDGNCTKWSKGDLLSINWQGELPFLSAEGEQTRKCIVSGVQDGYFENRNSYLICTEEGTIIMDNGETFIGSFNVITNYNDHKAPLRSPYLKSALVDYPYDLYSFDDILHFIIVSGNVVDKNNKIVGMYRGGTKLDEFDMASALAAEQGKLDKEKAEAQKAAKEKNSLISKYGKKYADAFLAGKVIIGMPWELVELGLSAHSFKDFYTALLSIDRTTSYGKHQCYSLYGDNFGYRGNMWINNNVVESITLY